jgi:hypothetical protein
MNKIKLPHILFSLALVAALALTVVPMAPAYALSGTTTNTGMTANQVNAPLLSSDTGVLVCRSIVIWRNGHRIVVRRCHKVTKPAS